MARPSRSQPFSIRLGGVAALLVTDEARRSGRSRNAIVEELAEEAAKTRLFPADYVRLEEQPSPAGRVALTLVDPWSQVRAVTLYERRDGGEWHETALSEAADHALRFTLTTAGQLDWYVEARSDSAVLAHVASRAEPRVLRVARSEPVIVVAPSKPSNTARVVGFIVLGAGVAAGAVATGLEVGGWNLRQAARDPTRAPGDFADTAQRAERDGKSQQTWATGLFIGAGAAVATGVVLAW